MKIVNTEKKNIYIYNHFIFYSLINKFLVLTLLTHLEKILSAATSYFLHLF